MKRAPISYTQALLADLEIRQGSSRGAVASRLVPDVSAGRARELLRQALVAHGMWEHNRPPNRKQAGS